MFAYLKRHHNCRLIFDSSYPIIPRSDFPKYDWEKAYENVREEIPSNAPEGLGFEFVIRAFVDADHAGDRVTQRSRTGFIIFINSAPIYWLSLKQKRVETSSFGS